MKKNIKMKDKKNYIEGMFDRDEKEINK